MIEVDVKYEEGEEKLVMVIAKALEEIHRKKFFFKKTYLQKAMVEIIEEKIFQEKE